MTLAQRLMRGAVILLILGACASVLPNNGGAAIADSGVCRGSNGPNSIPSSTPGRH